MNEKVVHENYLPSALSELFLLYNFEDRCVIHCNDCSLKKKI